MDLSPFSPKGEKEKDFFFPSPLSPPSLHAWLTFWVLLPHNNELQPHYLYIFSVRPSDPCLIKFLRSHPIFFLLDSYLAGTTVLLVHGDWNVLLASQQRCAQPDKKKLRLNGLNWGLGFVYIKEKKLIVLRYYIFFFLKKYSNQSLLCLVGFPPCLNISLTWERGRMAIV